MTTQPADPYSNLLYYNFASIHYFRHASSMLDLPVRTTGTAIYYYHRFHDFMSTHQGNINPRNGQQVDAALPLRENEELLTTTCLLLACKATEMPRKVRDLVNVGYRYYHPEEQLLNADEVYFQMRTSLTTCEMILVRALDCNLEIELPFACCLNVLRAMGAVSFYKDTKKQAHHLQKDVWKQMEQNMPHEFNVIARLAWLFLWDSLASPRIVLTHKTHEIALGSLYLALRMTGADLDMSMTEWVDQWGAAENVSVQSVRDVIQSLMELHDDGVQYVADHKKDAELLNRSSSSDSAIDPHSPTSPQE